MKYSVNNVSGHRISKQQINRLLKVIDNIFPKIKSNELSIAFVGNQTIKKLNKTYRHKNTPTDVLSFPEFRDRKSIKQNSYLGEIIISFPVAKKQAQIHGHTISYEIVLLLVHGFLHLIGYDHLNKKDEQEMKAQEATILRKLTN